MSKQIKDGGPAFPFPVLHGSDAPTGMTLRDYFAAKAMQSLIATFAEVAMTTGKATARSEVAAFAYGYADAMLAAREVKA